MSTRLILHAGKSAISDQELAEIGKNALKEREALLRKHPHLDSFQKEIDRMLSGAGSVENRMAVLGLMMECKLNELQEHLMHLSHLTSKMSEARVKLNAESRLERETSNPAWAGN